MFNAGGLCVEEQTRWYKDGCEPHRLFEYPLTVNSNVVDVGAYEGEWFHRLVDYHGFVPNARLFEPVNRFAQTATRRFAHLVNVNVFNLGLSNSNRNETFKVHSVETGPYNSCYSHDGQGRNIVEDAVVQLWDVASVDLQGTDLMSVNIEGGEYDLLYRMLETKQIEQVKFLQVQFHNLGENRIQARHEIRANLRRTHEEMYKYPFVWEAWRRK